MAENHKQKGGSASEDKKRKRKSRANVTDAPEPNKVHPFVSGEIVMERMTFYVISEDRLETLTEQNDDARKYKQAAYALFSFGAAFATHFFFAEHWSILELLVTGIVVCGCLLLGYFYYDLGNKRQDTAGGLLSRIRSNPHRARYDMHVERTQLEKDLADADASSH